MVTVKIKIKLQSLEYTQKVCLIDSHLLIDNIQKGIKSHWILLLEMDVDSFWYSIMMEEGQG